MKEEKALIMILKTRRHILKEARFEEETRIST